MRRPPANGREVQEAGEGQGRFVVSGSDAALVLEVSEQALDAFTVAVSKEVAGNGLAAIGLWRDDWQNSAHQQARADGVRRHILCRRASSSVSRPEEP